MVINAIKELFQKSDSSGSKSTILKPLTWLLSIIIAGLLILVKFNSSLWMIIMFSVIMGIALIIFFFAYIYCLFTDKDALRSEKYSIQKMAIEKGLYGDNISGFFTDAKLKNGKSNLRLNQSGEENEK